MLTDSVADMLTRVRNANLVNHSQVVIPSSKLKLAIAKILVDEGFVESAEVKKENNVKSNLIITLKYNNEEKVLKGLKRVSKPGLRIYANSSNLPKVMGGLGVAILSTSSGVMTDSQAEKKGVGGEVLAYVW
jgi:small subunit ribosomal protein S8